MNQLYTEYLIDTALKDIHAEAAHWEQLREARTARQTRGEGFRTIIRHLHMPRTRRRHSVRGLAVAAPGEQGVPC